LLEDALDREVPLRELLLEMASIALSKTSVDSYWERNFVRVSIPPALKARAREVLVKLSKDADDRISKMANEVLSKSQDPPESGIQKLVKVRYILQRLANEDADIADKVNNVLLPRIKRLIALRGAIRTKQTNGFASDASAERDSATILEDLKQALDSLPDRTGDTAVGIKALLFSK